METRDITISKEYLDRIRRFTAIRPEETFDYVPVVFRDLPQEQRPVFVLRPISGETALQFSDSMQGEVSVDNGKALVNIKRGEYTVQVVRQGLVSWKNYYDIDGRQVDHTKGNIQNLPIGLLEELCDVITSRSNLTKEEVLGLK